MDKKNLYYVIHSGTNVREKVSESQFFIGSKVCADAQAKHCDEIFTQYKRISGLSELHEIISVQDYEEMFGEDKKSIITEFINESVATIFVEDESPDIDQIKQCYTGVNFEVYYKGKKIAVLSGVHSGISHIDRDWSYPGRFVNYVNRDNGRILITIVIEKKGE